jgi:hypothetical protein
MNVHIHGVRGHWLLRIGISLLARLPPFNEDKRGFPTWFGYIS